MDEETWHWCAIVAKVLGFSAAPGAGAITTEANQEPASRRLRKRVCVDNRTEMNAVKRANRVRRGRRADSVQNTLNGARSGMERDTRKNTPACGGRNFSAGSSTRGAD